MRGTHVLVSASFRLVAFVALFIGGLSAAHAQSYCTPNYTGNGNQGGSSNGQYCDGILLETINTRFNGFGGPNADLGQNPDWEYQNFVNGTRATLVAGQTYSMTIYNGVWELNPAVFGNGNTAVPSNYEVWIDYDDDGTFASTERIYSTGGTSGNAAIPQNSSRTFSFTVPTGTSGSFTRLRVRNTAAQVNVGPCNNATEGETEDYGVYLIPSSANNLQVTEIVSPSTDCGLGGGTTVSVRVRNAGTAIQDSFDLSYQLGVGGTVVTETFPTSTILPNSDAILSFSTANNAVLPAPDNYLIRAWVTLSGDAATFDDTAQKTFTYVPTISAGDLPYAANFEPAGTRIGWRPATVQEGAIRSSWRSGPPPGPGVTGANSGSNAWYNNAPRVNASEKSAVVSPCFDLTGLSSTGSYGVSLALSYLGMHPQDIFTPGGGAALFGFEYSINGGISWTQLGTQNTGTNWFDQSYFLNQTFWSSSNGWGHNTTFNPPVQSWFTAGNQLPQDAVGKSDVRFRLVFETERTTNTAEGVAFDDFRLSEITPFELPADTFLCPGDTFFYTAPAGFLTYNWQGFSTPVTGRSVTIVNTNQYILRATDPFGFNLTDTIIVTFATADVNLGADREICEDSTLNLTYTTNTNVIPTWTLRGQTLSTDTIQVAPLAGETSVKAFLSAIDGSGCISEDSVSVLFNPVPTVDVGSDTSICPGSSVVLDAQTNIPNSSYLWSTGSTFRLFNASVPGDYVVTVTTPKLCRNSDTVNVALGANPSVNLGPDVFICDNLNIPLNAGNPGSSYAWNFTAQDTQVVFATTPGIYSVVVTNDDGCQASDTVIIGASPTLNLNLPATVDGCGQVTLDGTTANAATYLWSSGSASPVIVARSSGSYILRVTDANGCFVQDTVEVTIQEDIQGGFWAKDSAGVNESVQFVDNSTPTPDSWLWNFGDNTAPVSGVQNPVHAFTREGEFIVTLQVTRGQCSRTITRRVVVDNSVIGIAEGDFLLDGTVYPNPSNGLVTVDYTFAQPLDGRITVIDLSGRTVLQQVFQLTNHLEQQLDLQELPKGVYQLVLQTESGAVQSKVVLY